MSDRSFKCRGPRQSVCVKMKERYLVLVLVLVVLVMLVPVLVLLPCGRDSLRHMQ